MAFTGPGAPTSGWTKGALTSCSFAPKKHRGYSCRSRRGARWTSLEIVPFRQDNGVDSDLSEPPPRFSHYEESDSTYAEDVSSDGGTGSGLGSGDGNGDRDRGNGDDGERQELIRKYPLRFENMPDEIQGLPSGPLRRYLEVTTGGLGQWLADTFPQWRSRVAADPDFPFKLLMEETVGLGLTSTGMIAARGPRILQELDLVFCDLSVGATVNFLLTWLLQPTLRKSGNMSAMGRFIADLPANAFAASVPPKTFPIPLRTTAFFYKGVIFSVCGFAAATAGTALSYALLEIRRRAGAEPESNRKERPSILMNSAAWGAFMFVSSNPRYQLLAGAERALFTLAPATVAKTGCAALRVANNVLGGMTWVLFANLSGIQKRDAE